MAYVCSLAPIKEILPEIGERCSLIQTSMYRLYLGHPIY